MRTYDTWFPRYALRNRLMFSCRVFSPAMRRGSSALSTFLDRRTQRVNKISSAVGCCFCQIVMMMADTTNLKQFLYL